MRWSDLEDRQPRLAALGKQRLLEPGVVLVATIRKRRPRGGTPSPGPEMDQPKELTTTDVVSTAGRPDRSCGTATKTVPVQLSLPSVAVNEIRYTRPSPLPLRSARIFT